jgi:hypothetical protein
MISKALTIPGCETLYSFLVPSLRTVRIPERTSWERYEDIVD